MRHNQLQTQTLKRELKMTLIDSRLKLQLIPEHYMYIKIQPLQKSYNKKYIHIKIYMIITTKRALRLSSIPSLPS